jgi:PAS domain S-box-containing protein
MTQESFSPPPPFAVVVNDEPTQLLLISALVRKANLESHTFTGVEAALTEMIARAEAENWAPSALPALIVTDLHMPDIDGWRFCRLLRSPEYAAFNSIPILVVSATFSGEEPDRIATDLGAEAFLASPFKGIDFVERVQAILRGERKRPPLRVLIVENDKSQASIIQKAFKDAGYWADTAFTVETARKTLSEISFDVAILNSDRPNDTGDTLLDVFQTQHPDCICLMMSADPEPGQTLNWMKRGAATCLRKPLETSYLIEICVRVRRERTLLRTQDLLDRRTRELQESEERFRTLVKHLPQKIFLKDRNLAFLWGNENFVRDLGTTTEELVGKDDFFFSPRELAEKYRVDDLAVMDSGTVQEYEEFHITGGEKRFVHTIKVPYCDEQGQTIGILGIFDDITEHKRSEEELKKSEARFRGYFELSTAGLAITSPATGWVEVNDRLCEMLGYTREELCRKTWPELTHPEDLELDLDHFNRVLAGEMEGYSLDKRFICKNGNSLWMNLSVRCVRLTNGQVDYFVALLFDITQRKQAEEKLRLHSMVLEQILDHVTITDLNGTILYVNRAQEILFGRPKEEFLGRKTDVFGEDTKRGATQREILENTLAKGFWRGEVVNFSNDGREHIMDCRTQVIQDNQGHPMVLSGIATDITERKRAEKALHESQERLARAQRSAGAGMWDWDMSSGQLDWSPELFALFGLDPEHTPASFDVWRQLLHPDDLEIAQARITLAVQQGKPLDNEYRIVRSDGRTRWIHSLGNTTCDPPGHPIRMAGICLDVTERKRIEESLQETEAILQAALDQSTAGIAIAEAPSGKLRYVNDAGLLIRGGSRESLVNGVGLDQYVASWQILDLDGTSLPTEAVPLTRAILYGEKCSREFIIRRSDNDNRFVWANAVPITNEQGQITAGIAIFLDITERRKAEEEREKLQAQLQQAQKMESVGRLAGGVAHDFNNMLSVILGRTEMLLEEMDPAQPFCIDLQEIHKAAEHSINLTRQLLAFARKQAIAPKVLDLNETVEGMLKMLRRLIGEEIDLAWLPTNGLWPLKMDPSQIDQILANLCVNARDAINGKGRITIETDNVTFPPDDCADPVGAAPGDYILLAVSDDGCGMEAEMLSHLFEPFFTTKEMGQGTGLGLATIYGIVKQNNGFINPEFNSEVQLSRY